MSAPIVINLTQPTTNDINWEVILRTDEHIIHAISELIARNLIFHFDEAFLGNLSHWYSTKGKLSIKQSQTAIKVLAKRYSKRLQNIYDEDVFFKAYIVGSTERMDEEFVEVVSEFNIMMLCPICDNHLINTGAFAVITGEIGVCSQTVKCEKCHTTITFQLG